MEERNRSRASEYTDPEFHRYQAARGARPRVETPEELARGALRTWTIRGRPTVLTCLRGTLWLTRSSQANDLILGPGQSVVLSTGLWVVEALEPAQIHWEHAQPTKEAARAKKSLFSIFRRLRGTELCRA